MGTIVHAFDPNQEVYVISTTDCGYVVQSGTVIRVRTASLVTGVETKYDIRLTGKYSTTEFDEVDVFVDKVTAMTEYDLRVA